MISRAQLSKNIKNEFPRIKNISQYADLILEGKQLKAINSASSRKRREFLASGKVKTHVFSRAYLKLNLLVPIKGADKTYVLVSARAGMFFNYASAGRVLNYEKDLLIKHLALDPNAKNKIAKLFKLSPVSSVDTIRSKMDSGDMMKQAGVYDRVFSTLKKNGITPRGYMWYGVRTIPVSKYYLSNKSKSLLRK